MEKLFDIGYQMTLAFFIPVMICIVAIANWLLTQVGNYNKKHQKQA